MKPHKFYLLSFVALTVLGAMSMNASRISIGEAQEIAAKFRSNTSKYQNAPSVKPVYSASFEDANGAPALYIFNYGTDSGFALVNADSENPAVLGYSDRGNFNLEKAPANVRWWLSQYNEPENSVSKVRKAQPKESAFEDVAPIAPLVQTLWNQSAPYNNLCPLDGSSHSVTGCEATAMAQIMNYHKYPAQAQGSAYGVDMSQFVFDWNNMLDDYAAVTYNDAQATAVATLMYACGLSVDMNYSATESGASVQPVVPALLDNFGYSTTAEMCFRSYYSYAEWEELIYKELAASRPVLYTGQASAGGHAFVCDGYSSNGYFHFNWGWNGMYDGYFLLDALDPGTGGIGSFAGGYNSSQIIVVGIQPPFDNEPENPMYELCVNGNFVCSGFNSTYSCYTFAVDESPTAQPYFYNPMGYTENLSPGLKIVAEDDPQAITYQQSLYAVSGISAGSAFQYIYSRIPQLSDGEYLVYPAFIDESGSWHDALVLDTYQDYVVMNVSGGQPTFANPDLHSAMKGDLILNGINTYGAVHASHISPMEFVVSNLGDEDFSNPVTAYVSSVENPSMHTSFTLTARIPAGTTRKIVVSPDLSLPAGEYTLTLKYNGEELCPGQPLTILEAVDNPTGTLQVTGCGPQVATTGKPYSLELKVLNSDSQAVSSTLTFRLYDAATKKAVTARTVSSSLTFQGYCVRTVTIQPFTINAPAGEYYWIVSDGSGMNLSGRFPVQIVDGPYSSDGITYYIDNKSEMTGYVALPEDESGYTGDVVVPDEIDGVKIHAIEPATFTFSDEMTSLTLPASVSDLAPGELAGCTALTRLSLMSPTPGTVGYRALPEDPSVILGQVPYGAANLYARADGWKDLEWGNWTITLADGMSIDPSYLISAPETVMSGSGLLMDSSTDAPYEPYYVSAGESPEFKVSYTGTDRIVTVVDAGGIDSHASYAPTDVIILPAIDGRHGTLSFQLELSVDAVNDSGNGSMPMYTISGIKLPDGTLPAPGLYISGGRKVLVR